MVHLYNLTLSRASGIQYAIYGNFSAAKVQEVVVSRGKILELLRPNDTGKLQTICSTDVFGVIRSLQTVRLVGAQTDQIIVGSDSGRIVILKFSKDKNMFIKVHQETYGKSGCRRITPGQYLAVDPKGRACMIAAIEKQKFVYVLNRDAAANLTISSPLEAHKSHNIVFSIAALDVGFDNPVFAAIELDYSDADQDPTGEAASLAQKHLTFYELDLGLNHVIRKWSEPIDNGANLIIPVPGAGDGPGGVLVCAENFIIYKNENHEEVRAVIPRRSNLLGEKGVLIVSYASFRKKAIFFVLVQSEYGDIYKVTLEAEGEAVTEVKVKYFDTLPPAVSLCVFKTGFIFCASEMGNHGLYQFVGLGEDEDDVESSSATLVQTEEGFEPVFFDPRPLKNLQLVDEPLSLMPILDMKVANLLNEEIPQIYTLCGRGPRSALAVLRPGLSVTELAVSPLPGNPTAVWTVRRAIEDEYDSYIVVSFVNATLVFSIGEEVKETSDSGFLGTTPTLHTQTLADGSMLQVHPNGLRHIRPDRRINEWRAPGRKSITRAASNPSQVAVALSGGVLIYFELDPMGQLLETEKKDLEEDITALDVGPVPEGRQRCRFLAVGCADSTVRILSLDPDDCLKALSLQALPAVPESVLILYNPTPGNEGSDEAGVFLHTGLASGVLSRTEIDRITGVLSDTRSRFLGLKAPKLFAVSVRGQRSMLALSTRPWLGHSDMGRFNLTPLSYDALDYAAGFAADMCPEGFVAVTHGTLRVIMVDNVGEVFNQQITRLRYTPRKLLIHPEHSTLIISEADHGAIPWAEREKPEHLMDTDVQGIEFDDDLAAAEEQFGAPKGMAGQWASCLRVVDPASLSTKWVAEMDNNEAITSMALVDFEGGRHGALLCVGTAQGLRYLPTECDGGFIRVYRVLDNGQRLELQHKTPLDGVPGALAAIKGRLLVGVGAALRIYELGKKKLLRKCEYRQLPQRVVSLHVAGSRIYAGDVQESFHYLKYRKQDNTMFVYADDTAPRYVTAAEQLDYDTMIGGDKFGNVFVTRLPPEVSAQVESDPTGGKFAAATGKLNGAPHKLQDVVQLHIGETVTAIQRATMQPGGEEVILYATVMGSIGALYAFRSKEDMDFFTHLEMHLRQEHPPLCGRDHLAYRSYYFPVKSAVDGDLCSQFPQAPIAKQREIAASLERSTGEVLKKLEDVRNRIL